MSRNFKALIKKKHLLTDLFSIFEELQELLVFRLNLVDLFIQTFRVSTTQILADLFNFVDVRFYFVTCLRMLLLKKKITRILNIYKKIIFFSFFVTEWW